MQTVTRYKANDGSEWTIAEKCIERDKMIQEVKDAMSLLIETPDECNWEGYVQQDRNAVAKCKDRLFAIANREGVLKWWIDRQVSEHGKTHQVLAQESHPSWFGRMLDGAHDPLGRAYSRLCAIDCDCREWNQPYYAMNPGTGKNFRAK